MPLVLTSGSEVLCGTKVTAPKPLHGGTVQVVPTSKLSVGGNFVLTSNSVTGQSVLPGTCTNAPPPTGQTPCSKVTSVLVGVALRLTTQSQGVLLETLKGVTVGVPPGDLAATAKQSKLTSV
jgi:hypothetical protein